MLITMFYCDVVGIKQMLLDVCDMFCNGHLIKLQMESERVSWRDEAHVGAKKIVRESTFEKRQQKGMFVNTFCSEKYVYRHWSLS